MPKMWGCWRKHSTCFEVVFSCKRTLGWNGFWLGKHGAGEWLLNVLQIVTFNLYNCNGINYYDHLEHLNEKNREKYKGEK